jgi:hypothetical protein
MFFFEKKKQKNFYMFRLRPFRMGPAQTRKSFLLLFFKKEGLASLATAGSAIIGDAKASLVARCAASGG